MNLNVPLTDLQVLILLCTLGIASGRSRLRIQPLDKSKEAGGIYVTGILISQKHTLSPS
jgi:hypothetical protein